MERSIVLTEDGSHTLYVPEINENFHSVHGAVQESNLVFIKNGLLRCQKKTICVFEVGFGTGLNALLTLMNKGEKFIHYISIENYPLSEIEYKQLNYCELLGENWEVSFEKMHHCDWDDTIEIVPDFKLTKLKADITTYNLAGLPAFDLIYFDAFAPGKQPEIWKEGILRKVAENTSNKGIFVTYCAQGEVRRSLIRAGFEMQRIAGPPGKREMLYGEKLVG